MPSFFDESNERIIWVQILDGRVHALGAKLAYAKGKIHFLRI